MTSLIIAMFLIFAGLAVLLAVWTRWQRQMGGPALGRLERSDGSMTVRPTGYPEEMKGHAKTISPIDNA